VHCVCVYSKIHFLMEELAGKIYADLDAHNANMVKRILDRDALLVQALEALLRAQDSIEKLNIDNEKLNIDNGKLVEALAVSEARVRELEVRTVNLNTTKHVHILKQRPHTKIDKGVMLSS